MGGGHQKVTFGDMGGQKSLKRGEVICERPLMGNFQVNIYTCTLAEVSVCPS